MFFYSKILLRKSNVKVDSSTYLSKKTTFKGFNVLHSGVNVIGTSIGFATYIGKNCFIPNTTIGAYCSIAPNVVILPFRHPTSHFVSTHPAFYSLRKQSGFTYVEKQLYEEELFFCKDERKSLRIGNDVWIGANVLIFSGVEIGDGAIVAAGSLINKDVPPYAIVGGVPAKIIRYRFDKDKINFLLETEWWKKNPNWLKNNSELFSDIEKFISKEQNKDIIINE